MSMTKKIVEAINKYVSERMERKIDIRCKSRKQIIVDARRVAVNIMLDKLEDMSISHKYEIIGHSIGRERTTVYKMHQEFSGICQFDKNLRAMYEDIKILVEPIAYDNVLNYLCTSLNDYELKVEEIEKKKEEIIQKIAEHKVRREAYARALDSGSVPVQGEV